MKKYIKIQRLYIALLVICFAGQVYSQEATADQEKLDFLLSVSIDDSVANDDVVLFNLNLDIHNLDISAANKVYLKVFAKEDREVYLIRAIDSQVLSSEKEVKIWEKDLEKQEKEWEKERLKKSKEKEYKEYKELWSTPKYPKQEGRKIQKIESKSGAKILEFGPFSPGDYQVYVRLEDQDGRMYMDSHDITISSEIEE